MLIDKNATIVLFDSYKIALKKDKEIVFSLSFLAIASLFYSPMNMFHYLVYDSTNLNKLICYGFLRPNVSNL